MTPHADSDIVPPCDGTSLINSPDSARVMSRLVDTLIVLYMKSDPLLSRAAIRQTVSHIMEKAASAHGPTWSMSTAETLGTF